MTNRTEIRTADPAAVAGSGLGLPKLIRTYRAITINRIIRRPAA